MAPRGRTGSPVCRSGARGLDGGRGVARAGSDHAAVEAAFLATLTRRPTPPEAAHFHARLAGTTGETRKQAVTDLFWVLLNTTEFAYNH